MCLHNTGSGNMACLVSSLFSVKPLPKPMMTCHRLDPFKQPWKRFESKWKSFWTKNIFYKYYLHTMVAIFCLSHYPWGYLIEAEWCIYASVKLSIIGSDNGSSPGRCQAIIWANDGVLSIWPLRNNFNEILIEIHTFPLKKIPFKMSAK